LVQIFAEKMKVNPNLDFWLRSAWNSAATVLSVTATILGMWLGTKTSATPEDEINRRELFFTDLQKPFLFEGQEKKAFSPFKIIGLTIIAFALAIAAISLFILLHYRDLKAFKIDLLVVILLIIIGFLMRLGKEKETG